MIFAFPGVREESVLMSRICTVCRHQNRDDIEKALLGNDTFRHIAVQYNVSTGALQRHKKDHLIERLAEVQKAKKDALRHHGEVAAMNANQELCQTESMLDQIRDLRLKALSLLNQAEISGDLRTALAGIREARSCIELLAKIDGQLNETNQVNITLSTEWIALRTHIIAAIEPYPEARGAVLNAING